MIPAKELIRISKKTGIRAERLERDYVMSLILDALSRVKETKDDVVFKGGCCVHKCFSLFSKPENNKELDTYFTEGRFSSDIDLTISKKLMSTLALTEAFENVAIYLEKKHGLIIEKMEFPMHFNEKQAKTNSRSVLHYKGPMYLYAVEQKKKKGKSIAGIHSSNLKIDITADEKVVYNPEVYPIYHPYSTDSNEEQLQARCYTLQGMFAEKIRSLFERCSPRDLYDLHLLMSHPDIKNKKREIGEAMIGKFSFKKINLCLDESKLTKKEKGRKSLKEYCKDEWEHSLDKQIGNLGKFEDYWDKEKFPKILNFAKECVATAIKYREKENTKVINR